MADINITSMGINVCCNEHGRIAMDDDQALHNLPPRREDVLAGKANLAVGNILILDGSGDPSVIPGAEELQRFNCGWDVKTITGVNERTKIATFTLSKTHPDDADRSGDQVAFDAIRVGGFTPGSAWRTYFDVSHFVFNGSDRGRVWFRMWRVTSDGKRHESDWWDGGCRGAGIPFGSQA